MVRSPDPFWAYVEEMNDGRKKCKFCEQIYTRGTSVSRVKYHLSGIAGGGIKSCKFVPDAVQEEAHAAAPAAARAVIDGPTGKKSKVMANSSNNEADDSRISTSLLQQQNNEVDHGMTDCVPGTLEWWQRHIGQIVLPDEGVSPGDLLENETMGMHMHSQSPKTLQLTDPVCQIVDDVLMNDEGNMTRELEQAILRNKRETEHHVEGITHGDQLEFLAEATLRTAQVRQDYETTLDVPYLLMEDNFISNNMESASAGLMQHLEGGGVLEQFTVDEDRQPTDLQCQVNKRHCNQICSPSVSNDVLRNDEGNMTREPEQTVVGVGSHEGLQHTTGDEARGDVFPTPKLVGGAFEENKHDIWSWLMNDEVSLIGIYGMGGVGKTALAKHIHNQLLDKPDKYRHVYWITVSQDFSIYKLQNLIAKRIGLDLSNEDDEIHRAAKLSRVLVRRQNYVLILDDLWNHFEPEEMGIPSKMNGYKLILTTRSLDVCRRMGCEGHVIKVKPLSNEEAWNLFTMELGNYDIKLEPLAKAVASECDGLPLGIKTMARSMRGVHGLCEWRNVLEELKESNAVQSDMETVFRILKLSYLHLKDSAQQCFLACSLFPENFLIKRVDLIEFLIDERIIKGRKGRRAEFDKGHQILNRLENACLLESTTTDEGFSAVKMHDLVRDMAIQQTREKSYVMVEAGEQLEELPDEEKWSRDLVRVSLMHNYIKEIPSSHSPRCPNLSTLLLTRNVKLKFIGDSFFKQMQRLEVLDLSHTAIQELPDSISDLVTLTALLLGNCSHLTHVPSLGKLKALKKLDLHGTALKEVTSGLELLSRLKYLDLNTTHIQEFPAGILPKLSHLQVLRLRIHPFPMRPPFALKVEELACLRKLETLECHFDDLLAFKKYLKELDHDQKEKQQPSIFKFVIGRMEAASNCYFLEEYMDRVISLYGQEINKRCGDAWVLPKGIEGLAMQDCSDMKSLCDFYPSQRETELKFLEIGNCHSMECLVSFSQMSKSMLGTIETLYLGNLGGLHCLFSKEGATPTPLLPGNGIFLHLKTLQITYCRKLETLFPPGLLPNLGNLEEIIVRCCFNLEKIISEEESNNSSSDLAIELSLPKLRILKLEYLPALMSIGCGKLICHSLHDLGINSCERLKKLPFSCSPRNVKDIRVDPEIWWESVEWEEKNDYMVRIGIC